ncbi:MAG TPA: hypothetical protein VLI41_03715 [Phenylobacterium sp.]|uniref:hypothetical protein n=1 Tax=Phenylobacterium sp. TaxID=1871053 RepID=UPI002BDBAB13|nr:hypothetical protein [Phenylobacterium sp.]HSV02291.1 hypothetical protein [Phenylobacterium sp.]
MGHWTNFDNRAVIGRALRLRREIDDFETRWPAAPAREEATPGFTWAQLERQLVDLAATPAQAAMARHLVSANRKLAPFKPAEMVLREILCMTWVLLDESFRPEACPGSAETT